MNPEVEKNISGFPRRSERRLLADVNFQRARDQLQKILGNSGKRPSDFKLTIEDGETVESMAADLEVAIAEWMKARRTQSSNGNSGIAKVKEVMKLWFRVTYPIAGIFLSTTKDGLSVDQI